MATRPQFASLPKIAVLTSGELAIANAAFSASASLAAPRDGDGDELGGALAVARDHPRELAGDRVDGLRDERERGRCRRRSRSPPAAPDASRTHMSLVDVSHVDRDPVERERDRVPQRGVAGLRSSAARRW